METKDKGWELRMMDGGRGRQIGAKNDKDERRV